MFSFLRRLVLGGKAGIPEGWSAPAPVYDVRTKKYEAFGLAWVKRRPANKDDIKAIKEFAPASRLDKLSLVGKKSPKYDTGGRRLQREISKEVSWYKFRG